MKDVIYEKVDGKIVMTEENYCKLLTKVHDYKMINKKVIQILEEQLPIWREWHYDGCEVDSYIVEIIKLLKGENK